jgi:hypothetical protein
MSLTFGCFNANDSVARTSSGSSASSCGAIGGESSSRPSFAREHHSKHVARRAERHRNRIQPPLLTLLSLPRATRNPLSFVAAAAARALPRP